MSTWADTDRTIPEVGNARSADIAKIKSNFRYLATLLLAGAAKGWSLSVVNGSGTAEEPQYRVWSNGTERARATFTYASGAVTQIAWEYSDDSGTTPNATGTWTSMFTQTATYDGSGNQTTGNHSSAFAWLWEWIAKFKSLRAAYTAHIALTTGAHGTGNMALQAKSAIDITGGSVKGVVLEYVTARGKKVNLGNMSGTINIDWSLGDYFYGTVAGATVLTFSNLPGASTDPAGAITLELTNPGAFALTWPTTKWPGGAAPTRTVSGVDLYEFSCRDGATVRGAQAEANSA